ncbi:adenylyl-sulfate reductase subunit alpha [Archaeoglobus profundus]|uniref:Adenylylsulfate reductase, alpha subunit n=2 Tax=Archaeoglobus profundus (strain DSM 5631 / JCM 9629 / NBRC 100127 / Av18) TaxID=572546 RepID=D2RDW9_ARCPA|nr:adenylyl-sulfate reductase subunit alpha [Archaeoglobus profundus]ADB58313.1 adenylylsulfate reductase, alpha subunit [Archaeoglobus profundus DSM 5631]
MAVEVYKNIETYKPEDVQDVTVETDILIIGGGFSGCGAAYEAAYWAKAAGLKVTLVEKAAIERSGAVAQGLSAINTYLGLSGRAQQVGDKPNTIEDYVRYVTLDMMGIAREDLVADYARHVDGTVHLFEKWGLPIWKDENGKYVREGRWQVMIHGESYKPIIAEAAKMALGEENIYERVFITHLLMDKNDPQRVAGAVGFSVREPKFYIFKAKAVILATGGATLLFRPRSTGEGMGRIWYAVFNTGSGYAMAIEAGAHTCQMEHRFIPSRFKDGYGPVGAWFLLFKSVATNAFDEVYIEKKETIEKYKPYADAVPTPTPLRNHQMLEELINGRGPILMRTEWAIKKLQEEGKDLKKLIEEAWEDFLDMTVSQALLWAALNIEPEKVPSEIMTAEPYMMGSHSGCAGLWVCGPEDLMPEEYKKLFPFCYNRMTTIKGLFAVGDCSGANPHKFSSGSFTEGRIAGKAAVRYVVEQNPNPEIDEAKVQELKKKIFQPMVTYEQFKNASTREDINPNYLFPKQALWRLQKIMDEYAAGASMWYRTNEKMLKIALERLQMLKEDMEKLAARNLHELMRCWEMWHRVIVAEAHVQHMLFRQETRWPGYYYRMDYPDIDDENWKVFVVGRKNPETGEWEMQKVPYIQIVDWQL